MNALITNTINNIFHGIWLVCIVMEPKHSRKKTIMIAAGTAVFYEMLIIGMRYLRIAGILSYNADSDIAVNYLVGYLLAAFIFGGMYIFGISSSNLAKSLFLLAQYFNLWTLIYITISLVTGTFSGAGNIVIWALRIGLNLFFLMIYLLLYRQRLLRICKEVKSGYGIVATVAVIAFTVMTLLLVYNEKTKSRDTFYMFMIFLICVFMVGVYVLMFRFIEQSAHVCRIKQIQLHEKLLTAQIESYEKMEQNARQTRHDFRHHNLVVAEYAKNKDYQGILSYLNEYEAREDNKYTGSFCENRAVNSVLRAYADKAAQNGIDMKINVRLLDTCGVSDYDLVSILANVLENAVNACMKEDGRRELEITIKQKGYKLVLTCINTCAQDILFENGLPRNKENDGVGVESILCSAEKYNGDADFCASDGIFTCRVILNAPQNKGQRGA